MKECITQYTKEYQQQGKGFRWTKPENMHLTQLFIGNTPSSKIHELKDKITAICNRFYEFTLTYHKIDFAPPGRNKSMIWLYYHSNEFYTTLVSKLSIQLLNKQLTNNPIPHITLARFKTKPIIYLRTLELPVLLCSKVQLWQSVLTSEGPIYSLIHTFRLQKNK